MWAMTVPPSHGRINRLITLRGFGEGHAEGCSLLDNFRFGSCGEERTSCLTCHRREKKRSAWRGVLFHPADVFVGNVGEAVSADVGQALFGGPDIRDLIQRQ